MARQIGISERLELRMVPAQTAAQPMGESIESLGGTAPTTETSCAAQNLRTRAVTLAGSVKLNPRAKSVLKWLLKIALSALAIYLVSRKIDFREVFRLFPGLLLPELVLAFLLFNVSKILSAIRYQLFVHLAGASISTISNLKLYYIGMFYNLFLPGGIGGDGYKIYLLNKNKETNWKELTWATLIERISGLAAFFRALQPTFFA